MKKDKSPLHGLFKKLIAEEMVDPTVAKRLLNEIIAILSRLRNPDGEE